MFLQLRRSATGSAISICGMHDLAFHFYPSSCYSLFLCFILMFVNRVCNLGLIMHSMKSLMLETWSEQGMYTGM